MVHLDTNRFAEATRHMRFSAYVVLQLFRERHPRLFALARHKGFARTLAVASASPVGTRGPPIGAVAAEPLAEAIWGPRRTI